MKPSSMIKDSNECWKLEPFKRCVQWRKVWWKRRTRCAHNILPEFIFFRSTKWVEFNFTREKNNGYIEWQRYLSVRLLPLIHLWIPIFFFSFVRQCVPLFFAACLFFRLDQDFRLCQKVCERLKQTFITERGKTHRNAHINAQTQHTYIRSCIHIL